MTYNRVSTTPGNPGDPGNLLEFKNPPGNLLEFVWSSWKFLCKMSMIDCIGFQSL